MANQLVELLDVRKILGCRTDIPELYHHFSWKSFGESSHVLGLGQLPLVVLTVMADLIDQEKLNDKEPGEKTEAPKGDKKKLARKKKTPIDILLKRYNNFLKYQQENERGDVLQGKLLEDKLVSGTPRRISATRLGSTKNREVDSGSMQQPRQRHRNRGVAIIERTGATDEPQVLGGHLAVLAQDRNVEVELSRPICPRLLAHSPRVGLVLHCNKGLPQLRGKF